MTTTFHGEAAILNLETKPTISREIGGRPLLIVDDLLSRDVARKVFEIFCNLPYRFIDADREDTDDFRHFAHYFDSGEWVENPILGFLTSVAEHALASRGWEHEGISRIYANLTLSGDHQFIHTDGHEWTALFFVAADWKEDWGGELTLYDPDAFAPATSVLPKPGRMVLFDGEIPHRGGCPSRHCSAARISVAVKFRRP